MEYIADILLVSGALGAGFYCFVLSRRLSRFNDLEGGVGGAVAVLSMQVDDLKKTLDAAQSSAGDSENSLKDLTSRADDVARRLEMLVASMHDLPSEKSRVKGDVSASEPFFVRHNHSGGAK
jgi:chromosome segregation ATPase